MNRLEEGAIMNASRMIRGWTWPSGFPGERQAPAARRDMWWMRKDLSTSAH